MSQHITCFVLIICWINMKILKCVDFARFCVSSWKFIIILNHTKICYYFKVLFIISNYPRNQNPSRYHNSTTNLKFQPKPKYPHIKIDLLPRSQTPSATILYIESKHNILALVSNANKFPSKDWFIHTLIFKFVEPFGHGTHVSKYVPSSNLKTC